ncbi:MAG: hypothetical protein M1827_003209 [Pycnora praestabilis]|nr:MAG: hypothetical protein M1827_003209 [Pycnora praestabilis]
MSTATATATATATSLVDMLSDLPFEILTQITFYIPTARSVLNLSLTCRRLYDFTEKEGWRSFTQTRFPSISAAPYWKDAAHALTTLSRSWDRKAFIAQPIAPLWPVIVLPKGNRSNKTRRERGQTMGYQPVIDSYEEWIGNKWSAKQEILAWGAGAELVIRVKTIGEPAEKSWEAAEREDSRADHFNEHHHKIVWISYQDSYHVEGRDDVTSVNILRPGQKRAKNSSSSPEEMVVGRASGELSLMEVSANHSSGFVSTSYETEGRPIRSAAVNSSPSPLLAACLFDTAIALYSINHNSQRHTNPCAEIAAIPNGKPGRTWSTQFLAPDRLAVGLGPSTDPIHVYQTSPDGMSRHPIRKFSTSSANLTMSGVEERIDTGEAPPNGTSSVYPIATIPPSSQAGGGGVGDVFLGGWFDGVVRMHDMRSPSCSVQTYHDPIDNFSAIYSLATIGRERFIAGGARHAIMKVFDLRMAGGKAYYYTDLDACNSITSSRNPPTPAPKEKGKGLCCNWHWENKFDQRNWNIFLNPRGPALYRLGSRRSSESPIYSLSSPSSSSPSLFAGIENNVVQFDIVGIMDKHPDPVFGPGLPKESAMRTGTSGPRSPKGMGGRSTGNDDVGRKWDPKGDVMNLAMYEQVPMGSMRLRVQAPVRNVRDGEDGVTGWDERWCDGRGYY